MGRRAEGGWRWVQRDQKDSTEAKAEIFLMPSS